MLFIGTAGCLLANTGRNGEVKSNDDEGLTLRLAMPRSLGGKGDGQNPEMLFAMGYAGVSPWPLTLLSSSVS